MSMLLTNYDARWYQLPILDAIVNKGYKRVLACLPRRAGKDMTAWWLCIYLCLSKVGIYYYILPTRKQAKDVLWDTLTIDGRSFKSLIPEELIAKVNESELKIHFKTGSILVLVGSNHPDNLRGGNPCGTVWSEYAHQDPRGFSIVSPILAGNDGWALFLSCVGPNTMVITQNGPSYIKDLFLGAKEGYTDLTNVSTTVWGLG